MPSSNPVLRTPEYVTLLAAVGGAALLWFYRDVMSVDVALRILLTASWIAVWTLAALGAGAGLFRRATAADRIDAADMPVVLLTGAGVLSVSATISALAGLFGSSLLVILLMTAASLGVRECWILKDASRQPLPIKMPLAGYLLIAVGAALIPVLSAPPVMYDALNYHLAFPGHWLEAGRFVEFPRHGFSYYPSSYGMLYGYALASVGPWGATAIHYWFGVMATLAAASLGARLGGPGTAVWAAVCFGLTPAVLEVSTYATADLAVAAWGGGTVAALFLRPGHPLSPGQSALCGFLLGCAIAAKYLALAVVLLPFLAAIIPVLFAKAGVSKVRPALAAGAAASVPLLPWLLRNFSWTGNPLYPYLQGVLGGPQTDMSIGIHMAQIGGTDPGSLIWAGQSIIALGLRTLEPLSQGGFFGPHWLLLLPVAALSRWPGCDRVLVRSLWTFTIVGLVAWGSLVQMARFLLPVLVVAAPLAGSAAAALVSSPRGGIRWPFRVLVSFILVWNSTMIATTQNLDRLGVAAGMKGAEEAYMARWISYNPVIHHINHDLPPESKVLFVGEPRSFYVDVPVVIEDPFRTPLLVELAAAGLSAEGIADKLRSLGVTHVMVNTHEMPLSARLRGVDDYWDGVTTSQRAVIDEFLTTWLVPTGGDPSLWVARITPPVEPAIPTASP